MPRNCIVINNCIDCPAIAPTPSQSAQVIVDNVLGWNAGANSIAALSGNIRVIFSAALPTLGILIGFKASRMFAATPSRISHGLYLTMVGGLPFFRVYELGAPKDSNHRWFAASDEFKIQSSGGVVSYYFNGAIVYTSETRLPPGDTIVNACLYGAGDTVQ